MRAGARDYVLKDRLSRLSPALEREIRERAAREARRAAEESLRQAEEQLRQVQKMDAVGRLAGGIAHDFNNLLSVILGYSTMLADDMSETDPRRADLEEITAAGQRATELTSRLLAFSRRQILQPRIVNLGRIVAGMEKMLRRIIEENVELLTLSAPRLGKVRVDPGQIEQVIMNLAVNARDAMPGGGTLSIKTANVDITGEDAANLLGVAPGPHVLLSVVDTGSGMDTGTQARIFEPFFTTKPKGKGTGLGLATVFGIVQQSGGSVWVTSAPGQGTTFKIYFPEVPASELSDEVSPPAPSVHLHNRGSETILLVEDDEHVRSLARTILRRHGYHVLEADDGADARMICERHLGTIHLLLSDVMMPRIGGRELAEQLLVLRPQMRVLLMSGYTEDPRVLSAVNDASVGFYQKPITPDALIAMVRSVLQSPR
jgi:signal transduction histidine kinase/ActR/RegA family two-component response regulator